MMTELVLVEGVTDVQLISYYLQNVFEWKHIDANILGMRPLDKSEHIESLSKDGNQLILCGVGGNSKFASFIKNHRINELIVVNDISSLMVVTDRDTDSNAKIKRTVRSALPDVSIDIGKWTTDNITDSFGQSKNISTYLLIIPENDQGALEKVVIDSLLDMAQEKDLMQEVVQFIDSLKQSAAPELSQVNKANKATVGTFFSVRFPKNAMRSFGIHISKIDWSQSEVLRNLFRPFKYLGLEKPHN